VIIAYNKPRKLCLFVPARSGTQYTSDVAEQQDNAWITIDHLPTATEIANFSIDKSQIGEQHHKFHDLMQEDITSYKHYFIYRDPVLRFISELCAFLYWDIPSDNATNTSQLEQIKKLINIRIAEGNNHPRSHESNRLLSQTTVVKPVLSTLGINIKDVHRVDHQQLPILLDYNTELHKIAHGQWHGEIPNDPPPIDDGMTFKWFVSDEGIEYIKNLVKEDYTTWN